MVVLWWLVPPLAATALAMCWAAWAARRQREVGRDDSPAAMERMRRAIDRPSPRRGTPVRTPLVEPTHGVALRQTPTRPTSDGVGAR